MFKKIFIISDGNGSTGAGWLWNPKTSSLLLRDENGRCCYEIRCDVQRDDSSPLHLEKQLRKSAAIIRGVSGDVGQDTTNDCLCLLYLDGSDGKAHFHGNSRTKLHLIIGVSAPIPEISRVKKDEFGNFFVDRRALGIVVRMSPGGSFFMTETSDCNFKATMLGFDNDILLRNVKKVQELSLI